VWTLRLFPSGKRAEAVSQLRAATELDPLSPKDLNALNFILMNVGGYDEVIANAKRTLAINPTDYSSQQLMGRALVQKGLVNDGIAVFEKLGTGAEGFLGYSYAKVGRRAEAEQLIKKFPDFPWIQALISGGLGNKDRAIKGLEKMVVIKDPRTGIYLTMPELAILRGDPRVTNIRAELGLNQNQ
jgi:tetratricopeptide (TPR) repeat protein